MVWLFIGLGFALREKGILHKDTPSARKSEARRGRAKSFGQAYLPAFRVSFGPKTSTTKNLSA